MILGHPQIAFFKSKVSIIKTSRRIYLHSYIRRIVFFQTWIVSFLLHTNLCVKTAMNGTGLFDKGPTKFNVSPNPSGEILLDKGIFNLVSSLVITTTRIYYSSILRYSPVASASRNL